MKAAAILLLSLGAVLASDVIQDKETLLTSQLPAPVKGDVEVPPPVMESRMGKGGGLEGLMGGWGGGGGGGKKGGKGSKKGGGGGGGGWGGWSGGGGDHGGWGGGGWGIPMPIIIPVRMPSGWGQQSYGHQSQGWAPQQQSYGGGSSYGGMGGGSSYGGSSY